MESDDKMESLQEMMGRIQSKTNRADPVVYGSAPANTTVPMINAGRAFDFSNVVTVSDRLDQLNAELEESKQEQVRLREEFTAERDSHKHDLIKNIIITLAVGIICAAAGVAFSILAFKSGLLK